MRWVAPLLSLVTVGFGVFLVLLSVLLSNRSSNTGLMAIGAFILFLGLGLSVWTIPRSRRRNKQSRWRSLDH